MVSLENNFFNVLLLKLNKKLHLNENNHNGSKITV